VIPYNNPMSFAIFNQRTRLKKGLVFYFKNNVLITLKKHLNANHVLSAKKFEEEMNIESPMEKQFAKKKLLINENVISNFLWP
jgi:hypothetical protein